jgi:hypothetical protein
MTAKPKRKPKLTDAERHKRFIEMAREVKASEKPEDFDRAFTQVISGAPSAAKVLKPSKS